MHTDRIPEPARSETVKALRRAEGQVRAVAASLESGTDCRQLVHQLAAAKNALERAGVRLLAAGLAECLREERDEDLRPADFEKLLLSLT